MPDLETMIAEAARSGRLTALTLWPSGKGWQANARNNKDGWNCVPCTDPVDGLRKALVGPFSTTSAGSVKTTDKDDAGVFG